MKIIVKSIADVIALDYQSKLKGGTNRLASFGRGNLQIRMLIAAFCEVSVLLDEIELDLTAADLATLNRVLSWIDVPNVMQGCLKLAVHKAMAALHAA
jgi:hypothetical protein